MRKVSEVALGFVALAWGAFIFYPLLPLLILVGLFAVVMAVIEHVKGGN